MSQYAQLIQDLASAIEQGAALLQTLDDGQFTKRFGNSSSIGAHHRHVLEYANLLVDGLEQGRVDYDARERNVLIETNREAAIAATRRLCERIRGIHGESLLAPIEVAHCTSMTSDCAVQSTGAREFLFVLSHVIHHWALVRYLLEAQELEVPATFGFMPSTLRQMSKTQNAVNA
ncbi:MAG: hypothetical protein R3E66_07915 [bacterium]